MEIKGYKILREISRGPVTTVYLAEQTVLERPVVLKVLNVQWKNENDLIERLRREAKISARLRHPNIINIYDFGISGEHFYLSIEYIKGFTLARLIQQHHPLPPAVVLYIMREILTGLDYAHKMGVIHRDIKPSNIMIQEDGVIKIADFGMAIITDLPGLTEQGSAVGSPAYMSPEQALGKKIDATSDIFSLAVTVYEMLTAHSPFRGLHVAESINKTLNEQPPALHTVREDVPQWLSMLIGNMLEKEARKRPSDCEVLLNRLSSLSGLPDRETFMAYLHDPHTVTLNFVDQPAQSSFRERQPAISRRVLYPFIVFLILVILFLFWPYRSAKQPGAPGALPTDTVTVNQKPHSTGKTGAIAKTGDVIDRAVRKNSLNPDKRILTDSRVGEKSSPIQVQPAELFVVCTPWADIYINDKKVDTTPLRKTISLIPGNYSLQLKNPGFQTYRSNLILHPAQKETLRVTLQNRLGYLNLRVSPWAQVYIDGNYYETTPLSAPLSLPDGKHLIELKNPAFATMKDTVWIEAGRTKQKWLRFKK